MSNHSDTQPSDGAVLAFPEHKSIQTQASEWLAKLDAEHPSPQDLAAFKQWVNASSAHRIAFEDMVDFWDEMNILTQAVLPREPIAPQAKPRRRFAPMQAAIGTTALAIIAVVSILSLPLSTTIYTTGVGEQKIIQLADNSVVQLNTNSRLQVDYSNDLRRLSLTQGEAHFDVAHNPQRPFEVLAGQGLVRAIGTAFTVHIRKIDVEVIVTEGTVELAPAPTPQVTAVPIADTSSTSDSTLTSTLKATAGSMVTFDKNLLSDVEQMVASQLEKQLSWREGMLVFKAEPLQSVVDEVSRYTNLTIIIPQRRTREIIVGGLFKVGDTESLFEALREGFDIHAKEVSSNVVHLISSENQ
jgi:transmembrane sensor